MDSVYCEYCGFDATFYDRTMDHGRTFLTPICSSCNITIPVPASDVIYESVRAILRDPILDDEYLVQEILSQ